MRRKGLFMRSDTWGAMDVFAPIDERALETIQEVDRNKKVLLWVHSARYPEHHRLAFVVMECIAEALNKTVDIVLLSLKYETGRFDYVQLVDGTVITQPHSIAFESMDQAAFQKFWDDVKVVIKDRWHLSDDVLEEINELLK